MERMELEKIRLPIKKMEVLYVPDNVIEKIISNDIGRTPDGSRRRKEHTSTTNYNLQNTPTGSAKRSTRSGRQIISKFQEMTLNGDQKTKTDDLDDIEIDGWPDSNVNKPNSNLFEKEMVTGDDIFSFRTPRRHNGMINKATKCVSILKRPADQSIKKPEASLRKLSPPKSNSSDVSVPKTPYSLRTKFRQRIAKEVESQELDRLLEDSGSEYEPSSDSENDTSESSSDDSSQSPEENPPAAKPSPPKRTRKQIKDYIFKSEEYFDRRYSKIMTSNNTLKKLKTPKLAPSQLDSLIRTLSKKHVDPYDNLKKSVKYTFRQWIYAFSEGFNVMLYGLGSKEPILEEFKTTYLSKSKLIFIKGYFPDVTAKKVLNDIATLALGIADMPSQPHEILEVIAKSLEPKSSEHLFVLVSNLDGPCFQSDKAQMLLSQLAKIKKIHIVATIDHINSALLWDQSKLSSYNFIWIDATTFSPYKEETSYKCSIMVSWSGGHALSSLKNIFSSLTINSRNVFNILLKHHFENHGPKYQGMHFSELYRECRNGFVVSSDLALRTLLTEFIDHELVKWKKETDHLLITVDTMVLKQFQIETDLTT